jgi:hypothetical protein
MPLGHGWTTAQPNNPAHDVSKDNMNTHVITGDFDIVAAGTEPSSPASGVVKHFLKITGASPNRNIVIGYKLEDGTVIILVDITI